MPVGGFQLRASFAAGVILLISASRYGIASISAGRLIAWGCLTLLATGSVVAAALADTSISYASFAAFVASAFFLTLYPTGRAPVVIHPTVFTWLVRLGVFVAAAVIVQALGEFFFDRYLDPIASLPRGILVAGYNTRAPVSFADSFQRPNGWLFVEPSVASQFLGVAAVVTYLRGGLARQSRRTGLVAIIGALVLTASGTGLIVMGVGLVGVVGVRRAARPMLAIVGFVAVMVASTSPSAAPHRLIVNRFEEVRSPVGSGHSRFILPYETVLGEARGFDRLLFGAGPATADARAQEELVRTGRHELFNTLLKSIWEYGVPVSVFLLVLLTGLVRAVAVPYRGLAIAVAIQYLALTGSLVSPFLPVLLVTIVIAVAAGEREVRQSAASAGSQFGGRNAVGLQA